VGRSLGFVYEIPGSLGRGKDGVMVGLSVCLHGDASCYVGRLAPVAERMKCISSRSTCCQGGIISHITCRCQRRRVARRCHHVVVFGAEASMEKMTMSECSGWG
jgi:hypothetical protein